MTSKRWAAGVAAVTMLACRAHLVAGPDMVVTPVTRTLNAPAPPPPLDNAFLLALRALTSAGDPIVTSGIGFQTAPRDAYAATLLLAENAVGSDFRLPFLCDVRPAAELNGVRLCDHEGTCGPIAGTSSPVMLCNLQTFMRLAILTASIHSAELVSEFMSTDEGYMRLTALLDQDPLELTTGSELTLVSDHNLGHMFPIVVLVLAHEFHHIANGLNSAGFTDGVKLPTAEGRLDADQVCRNYLFFEQSGYYLAGDVGELKLEAHAQVSLVPYEAELAERAVAIWSTEEEADKYAAQTLRSTVEAQLAGGFPPDEVIVDYTFTSLRHATFYLWYRRLRDLVYAQCNDLAAESFVLSRCMCRDRENYERLGGLFESTHPPVYLRFAFVLRELYRKLELDEYLSPPSRQQLRLQLLAYENLMEAPLKLALGACMKNNIAAFGESKVTMKYPALEGFLGEPNTDFWGAPPDSEWGDILTECLTAVSSPPTHR